MGGQRCPDLVSPDVVSSRPRFARWDYPVYGVLTLLSVGCIGFVLRNILGAALTAPGLLSFALAGAPAVLPLVFFESRWLTLWLMRAPVHRPPAAGLRVAVVTTFVPGAEPLDMLEESVQAMVAMRYPHETWVLDEGDRDEVRVLCERLGAHHFSRLGEERYQMASGPFAARTKHGNYNSWLDAIGYDRYDVIANFDPDHIPSPAFLERTLGHLRDDEVGYVQAAQVYYNQSAGLVPRGAAEETYAYYSSVQMTAYALGYPIVTGCHTVQRTTSLREVGGFAAHEADDLLITILYRVAGWRGVYVPEILAQGLAPVDWPAYLAQQRRWARSVLDVKLRIFPTMARRLPLRERVVSLVHGLYYLQGIITATSVAGLSVLLATGFGPKTVSRSTVLPLIGLLVVLPICDLYRQRFSLDVGRERGLHVRAAILRFAKWPYVLFATFDTALVRYDTYVVTRKGDAGSGASPRVLARPHLTAAAIVMTAGLIGWARGLLHPPVASAGVIFVLFSVLVTILERPTPGPGYDRELAARRGPYSHV